MMTEDTAREKLCPVRSQPYLNSFDGYYRECTSKCVASDCMAWRESPVPASAERMDVSYGYCGLAGDPK